MRSYIFILSITVLLISFKEVNAKSSQKYRMCLDQSTFTYPQNRIENKDAFIKGEYDFEMVLYKYSQKDTYTVGGFETDGQCIFLDKKHKVVLNSAPSHELYCYGHWDQNMDRPVWIQDQNTNNGSGDDFIPSFRLKNYLLQNQKISDAEIQDIYSTIECIYKPYSKLDILELNNSAFYLSKLGDNKDAITLLNEILRLDRRSQD